MLEINVKSLNEISDKYTKAELDFISNGECTFGAFLHQEELVSEIKIYISYLGFIDGLIMREREGIEWDEKFKQMESKDEHLRKYNYYLEERNKLIKIIENQTAMTKLVRFEFLSEVLATVPAFDKFDLVYQDLKKNDYQLNLQLEFINSYNTGFAQCGWVDYERLAEKFEESYREIETHKSYNKKRVENAILEKWMKRALD